MRISIIALAANLSTCNNSMSLLGFDSHDKDCYRMEGDLGANELIGNWEACLDTGDGFYTKMFYSFDENTALSSKGNYLYSDSKCTKLSDSEGGIDGNSLLLAYTVESVKNGVYFIYFEREYGSRYYTSVKFDEDFLLEASSAPIGDHDGSTRDNRANFFADAMRFRKI